MASAQSKVYHVLLRLINKKGLLKRQFNRGTFDIFAAPEPPEKISKTCHIKKHQVNGRNVFTLSPKQNGTKKHILYFHGGAYVTGFIKVHWYFLQDLVSQSQCTIVAPDYPLAPRHSYKETFEMVDNLYQEILATVLPENLTLMGDSAGGGLALALAQKLRIDKTSQPNQIILLSPWLDITLSNPEIAKIDQNDPFTGIEGLRLAGKAYAGGTDPAYFLLSPVNGPLDGLGKISIFIGTKEIMIADTRKLKARLEAGGVSINYYEYEDMVHVWMLLRLPESKKARMEIISLLRR